MPVRRLIGLTRSTVLQQSVLSLVVTGAGRVLTLLLLVFLARVMGAQEFGKFSYVRNLVFMIGPVSSLGFGPATSKFVPQALALGRKGEALGYVRYAFRTVAGLATLAAILVCLWWLARGAWPPDRDTLAALITLAAIPGYALLFIGTPAARSFGKVFHAYIPNFILQPGGQLVIMFAIALAFMPQADFLTAAATFFASVVAAAAVQVIALRRAAHQATAGAAAEYAAGTWLRVALPLAVSVVAVVVIQRSGPVIVGGFVDPALTGIFIACASLATTLSMPREAVNGILLPRISAAWALKRVARVRGLLLKGAALGFAATAAVAAFAWYFADVILGLYGPEFRTGATLFSLMALEQVIVAAAGPVGNILSISGSHWTLVKIQAATAAGRALMVLIGMAYFNIETAVAAAVLVMAAATVVTGAIAWRKLFSAQPAI